MAQDRSITSIAAPLPAGKAASSSTIISFVASDTVRAGLKKRLDKLNKKIVAAKTQTDTHKTIEKVLVLNSTHLINIDLEKIDEKIIELNALKEKLSETKGITESEKRDLNILIDKYRLNMMKAVLRNMREKLHMQENAEPAKKETVSLWRKVAMFAAMILLSIFPLTEGAEGAMKMTEFVAEILFHVKDVPITPLGLVMAGLGAIWTVIFFCLEGTALLNYFGIYSKKDAKDSISVVNEEIETAKAINGLLKKHHCHPGNLNAKREFTQSQSDYTNIAKANNAHLVSKALSTPEFEESGLKKAVRIGFTALGSTIAGSNAAFAVSVVIGSVLTGGWLFAALTLGFIAGALFYCVLQGKSLKDTLNPVAEQYTESRDSLVKFAEKVTDTNEVIDNSLKSAATYAMKPEIENNSQNNVNAVAESNVLPAAKDPSAAPVVTPTPAVNAQAQQENIKSDPTQSTTASLFRGFGKTDDYKTQQLQASQHVANRPTRSMSHNHRARTQSQPVAPGVRLFQGITPKPPTKVPAPNRTNDLSISKNA